MKKGILHIHPGENLLEDFLNPMGISQYRLAKSIGVPQRRIGEIVAGKRSITADTALRLARFFGTDAQTWINLQTAGGHVKNTTPWWSARPKPKAWP